MSSSDTYLGEKLKEILLRLYPNQTKLLTSTTPSPKTTKVDIHEIETIVVQAEKPNRLTEDQILAQSLTEFIKILKMYLNDNQGTPFSKFEDQKHMKDNTLYTPTISYTDTDFNLSAADIEDLNEMLNDSRDSVSLKHVFIILLYMIIAFVAIVGNLLVIQLVIKSRRLHTLTHVLLANLAVADLMLATINIPFSAARVILDEWPFGSFLCRVVPFVQVASVYAISYTMAVIACDRYQVIMHPLGRRLKNLEGIPLVAGIWLLSLFFSTPYALHHQVVSVLTLGVVRRCQAEFQSIGSRQLLTVGTFLLQYLIPLTLTSASYASIMRRLGSRSLGLGSTTPRQAEAQARAKIKTIRMLVLTVIFFAVSWAPINAYHLLTHFKVVRHDSVAILVAHMIAMSSSCYNPYIYCWLNEHFRQEAARWFRCFRTRRSPMVHPGVEVNGMLTRTDLVLRRNQSSTVVHTTSFRSPLPPQLALADSRIARGFRPEFIFLTTTATSNALPQDDAQTDPIGTFQNESESFEATESQIKRDEISPNHGRKEPPMGFNSQSMVSFDSLCEDTV